MGRAGPGTDSVTAQRKAREIRKYQIDVGILTGQNLIGLSVQHDPRFCAALASAYNDWVLEDFQGAEPARLVALPLLPVDFRRCRSEGCAVGTGPHLTASGRRTTAFTELIDPLRWPESGIPEDDVREMLALLGFQLKILGANGYAPVAVGKWHLTPEDETHMAAPRDTWPCGRGFQRWYGFHGGETHQFVPSLFQDNHAVRPPQRRRIFFVLLSPSMRTMDGSRGSTAAAAIRTDDASRRIASLGKQRVKIESSQTLVREVRTLPSALEA